MHGESAHSRNDRLFTVTLLCLCSIFHQVRNTRCDYDHDTWDAQERKALEGQGLGDGAPSVVTPLYSYRTVELIFRGDELSQQLALDRATNEGKARKLYEDKVWRHLPSTLVPPLTTIAYWEAALD